MKTKINLLFANAMTGVAVVGTLMNRSLVIGTMILGAGVIGAGVIGAGAVPAAAEPASTAKPASKSALPQYVPATLSSDSLTSVGSDSMDGLVRLWVDEYKKYQPTLKVQVVSRGSATAPAALIEGSADLGPMARPMKASERETFKSTYGFEPTQVRTAIAAVAVYVPKTNSLNQISFQQLEGIFADADTTTPTAAAGETSTTELPKISAITSWSALNAKVKGNDSIVPLGQHPDTNLGTYFKQSVLSQRPYSQAVFGTADNESLFEALEMNPSGIGFGTPVPAAQATGLKVLAVSKTAGSKAVLPSESQIVKGNYPLAKYLSIYVVREPGKGVEPALEDFLRFVLSEQGQKVVSAQGLTPLPASVVKEELAKLK